jgi:hypothetical protein
MGHQIAQDIARSNLPLHDKLHLHLSTNHYPPIDDAFISTAMVAVALANTNIWDVELTYPNGLKRSVEHTIKGMHLEPFLEEHETGN